MTAQPVVAVIPVREGSTRIVGKNFRPFGKAPTLLHHKIGHAKAAGCFSHVYVSSDSDRAKKIAEECGVEFLPRDPLMCTGGPRWDEVVVSIMQTVPDNPHVAWTLVTGPLFGNYADAVKTYLANLDRFDSLVGVKKIQEYLLDEAGRPLFFGFGRWHPYTNEIKPLFSINDAIFIARKSDQIQWRYWFGPKPFLYVMNSLESIDINFPEDLEMAEAARIYMERKQSEK